LPLEKQEEYFLIWNRENFWDRNKTGKAIYFGHTPSRKEDHTIVCYPNNCTCIDLGTYRYNKIGGIEIKSKEEYYIEMLYQGDDKRRFVLGEVTGYNPLICFGVNPSNAKIVDNKLQTDRTIEKIRHITDMENYDGWIMLNLYAQVTPEPNELHKNEDFDIYLHEKNINIIKEILKNYPNADILAKLKEEFGSGYASDEETSQVIKKVWDEEKYLLDPHTAVAYKVMLEQNLEGETVVLSTASPYKFCTSVANAVLNITDEDEFKLMEKLYEFTKVPVPENLKNLNSKEIRHSDLVKREDMAKYILEVEKCLK